MAAMVCSFGAIMAKIAKLDKMAGYGGLRALQGTAAATAG
jgi:hypothetical protein